MFDFFVSLIGAALDKLRRLFRYAIRVYQIRALLVEKNISKDIRLNGLGVWTGAGCSVVGRNVHIGDNYFIRAEGGLSIGENTHISRNVTIYTVSHEYEGSRIPYDDTLRKREVKIGNNVWVGMNVTILPGAVVEDGAIIGAGSVVVGHIGYCEIAGAAVANRIKDRDKEKYEENAAMGNFGGVNGGKIL